MKKPTPETSPLSLVLERSQVNELLMGQMKNAAIGFAIALMKEETDRICGRQFEHKRQHLSQRGGSEQGHIHVAGAKYPINDHARVKTARKFSLQPINSCPPKIFSTSE